MSSAILIQTQPSPHGKEASFEKVRQMVLAAKPTPGSLILCPKCSPPDSSRTRPPLSQKI